MEENPQIMLDPPIIIGENPPITIQENSPITMEENPPIRIDEGMIINEEKIGYEKVNIVVVQEFLEVEECKDNFGDESIDESHDIKTENIHLFDEATYAIDSATQALEQAQEAVIKIKNLVNDFIMIEGIADPLVIAQQCCKDAANAVQGACSVWQELHRQDISTSSDQNYQQKHQQVKVKSEEENYFDENKEENYMDEDYSDELVEPVRKTPGKIYRCENCDFVAAKKIILTKHINTKHKTKNTESNYQCENCTFTCDTERTYKKHALLKHKVKLIRCCQCEKIFANKDNLQHHIKEVHANGGEAHSCKVCQPSSRAKSGQPSSRATSGLYFKYIKELLDGMYQCELCDYKHKDSHATRKHVKKHHLSNVVHKCEKCDYVARDYSHLKEHILAKHEGVTFPCPWEGCPHVSSQKRNLKKHVDVIHRRIEHTCKECPFKTRHPELLKKHMKLKHLVDSYFCDECTYAAPTLVSLNTHKGKAHPPGEAGKIKDAVMSGIIHTTDENGVRMYKCDHCDYATNHLNNLKHVHMKKHTGELLQCDYCTYTTWSKSALNTHIKARHEEHKYRCDQCDFTSSLGFQFRRHYQSKHEGTVFKCDKCEFTAIRPEYLKKHARKHEGKAFKCEFEGCSFVGPYMSDLKVHIDAVHKGIRHKCSECEFTSGRKGDLNKHMKKVHGSEGHKFRCLRCPFATSFEAELLNHVKVVHDPEIAVLIMDEIKLNMAVH